MKNSNCILKFFLIVGLCLLSNYVSLAKDVVSCSTYEQFYFSNEEVEDLINTSFDKFNGKNMDSLYFFTNLGKCYAQQNNYQRGVAMAEKNLGFYYYLNGDFDRAILHLSEAEKLVELFNFKIVGGGVFAFYTLIYTELAHYEIALSYNMKFRKIATELGNKAWQKEVNVNFLDIYLNLKDLEKAKYYFNLTEYENLYNRTQFGEDLATGWFYLKGGIMYRELNQLKQAEEYLSKSISLFRELEHGRGIALAEFEYFMLAKHKGDYETALDKVETAIKGLEDLNFPQNHFTALIGKGEILLIVRPDQGKQILLDLIPKLENYKYYRLGILVCELLLEYLQKKPDLMLENKLMRLKLDYLKLASEQKQKLFEIFRDNEQELYELKFSQASDKLAFFKQQMIMYIALIFSILLLGISTYWYWHNNIQRQRNKQLIYLNEEISDKMDLVNDQKRALEKMNDKLEEANKSLENFAAIAAHDLRSPLANIYKLNQIVFNKYNNLMGEDDKETTQFIEQNIKRLMRLIDDLLSFSRINKENLELRTIDLNDVLALVKHNLSLEIQEKQAIIEHPETLPCIKGDFNLAVALFQNLLHNSMKFVFEDKVPYIDIGVDEKDGVVHVKIKDNGIGIAKHKIKKVFTLFEKLNGVAYGGSGVGLSSCKKIVEFFNGKIWIESVENHGTIVNLEFQKMPNRQSSLRQPQKSSL